MTEQMTLEKVRDWLKKPPKALENMYRGKSRKSYADEARGLAEIIDAHLNAAKGEAVAFAYAYRYPDGIRTNTGGREINGCKPTETIPLYTHPATPGRPPQAWVLDSVGIVTSNAAMAAREGGE